MNGTKLKLIYRRLIKLLNASEEEVFIREYVETGGHPESGIPPDRVPHDTAIAPRPIVTGVTAQIDAQGERITDGYRILDGDMKIVMDAEQMVSEGTVLHFRDLNWNVYRVDKPALFGSVQLIVAYVRRMQSGVN